MGYININGRISAAEKSGMQVDNGAFRYGYGLFETMLVQNGVIMFAQYHTDRLFEGMEQLYFNIPSLLTSARLMEQVMLTVQKNELEGLCRVRLEVYAGQGGMYGSDIAKPGYLIECFPLNEEATMFNENGLQVGIVNGLAKSADALANMKTCSALIYAMAAQQARQRKWNDALISNTKGNIIESTIANIFWVKGGTIYTPPLSEGCVAGVMRRHIMSQISVEEQPLTTEELSLADEVFLTNAIKRIKWIGAIGDKRYLPMTAQSLSRKLFDVK